MLSASGDNLIVFGSVTNYSKCRKIRSSDQYNREHDKSVQSNGAPQLLDRFKIVSTIVLKGHDSEEFVKLFLYDGWAENLKAIVVGDKVTLEVSPELLRDARREARVCGYSYAIALHNDEDVTSPHYIRVRTNSTSNLLLFV